MRNAVILALALTPAGLNLLSAQTPGLGPVDGHGLSPTDTGRVTVGHQAPDFTLRGLDGSRVTLSDLRGRQNVVLVFYRGHW